jgi:hypothetical protein
MAKSIDLASCRSTVFAFSTGASGAAFLRPMALTLGGLPLAGRGLQASNLGIDKPHK